MGLQSYIAERKQEQRSFGDGACGLWLSLL